MPNHFDVYMLEEFVPVLMGTAKTLDDAEKIIQAKNAGNRFLVYSQPTGVKVFYDRTPDGSAVSRRAKHAAA